MVLKRFFRTKTYRVTQLKYSPVWREFQIENPTGTGNVAVGVVVLPLGDGIQGRVHLAVQTTLIAVLRPVAVLTVAQIRVPEVGAPAALDAHRAVRVVVRRAHGVDWDLRPADGSKR